MTLLCSMQNSIQEVRTGTVRRVNPNICFDEVKSCNFLENNGATSFMEVVVKKKEWRYCSCETAHSKTEMKIRMLRADKDSLSDVDLMPLLASTLHIRHANQCDHVPSIHVSRCPVQIEKHPSGHISHKAYICCTLICMYSSDVFFSYVRAGAVMKCQAMG